MSDDSEALEREFDAAMTASGIVVPDDLRGGAIASYRDLRVLRSLLRVPRAAEDEPGNVFVVEALLRGR